MKEFIKNKRQTIIDTLIIIVFFLPVTINLYSILLGSTIGDNQFSASFFLFGIGVLLLWTYRIEEL